MLTTIDCSRKRAYDTYFEALEVARHQMEIHVGRSLRVYQCDLCSKYHLTHKPQRF